MNGLRAAISALTTVMLLGTSVAIASPGQAAPGAAVAEAGQQSAEEAASAAAEASGERVEVVESRTDSRQVYANPDGSFTMELSAGPTLVPKGNGWVEPDTTLVRQADGTVAPVASVKPVVFSGGGSTAPLVRLSQWDQWIELRWPDPLPVPTLSGDTATYANVLAGVDLQLTATAQGFSPVLVVKTREAADNPRLAEVELGFDAHGLTVALDPEGGLAARNDAGDVVFESSRVEMTDSPALAARMGDEPIEAPTVGALQSVGKMELSGDKLTLIPDQKLLDHPDANYPVQIDPYWTAPQNAWAKVMSGKPTSSYWFGGLDGAEAKAGYCGWAGCNGIGVVRSYFQFDTGALAGANILGAEFNVRETWAPSCQARPVELWRTGAIGAGTTWNAQPAGSPIPGASANVAYGYGGCAANWIGYGVASALSPGGLTTFMLKAANEGDAYAWKRFDSFAAGERAPRLIVTYNWPPSVPANLWANAGQGPSLGCASRADEAFTYSARPTLRATLSDPDGQNVAAKFEWWNYGGGVVGSAQTTAQPSGSQHAVTIPSGAFGNGKRISWRVQAWDGIAWSPWSAYCQLTVDSTAPGRPSVTSTDYPENAFGGYVGKTGAFTVRTAGGDSDVLGFQWSLDFADFPVLDLNSPHFVRASNGVATIGVTPIRAAPTDLYVRAVDRALNVSQPYQKKDSDGEFVQGGYHFLVGTAVPPPVGHWPLDGDYLTVPRNSAPDVSGKNRPATVSGTDSSPAAATWTLGRDGEALRLNGSDTAYATTGAKAVDTNATFSVSAWVNLNRQDTGSYAAVSQDGSNVFGFFLGYVGDDQRFTFRMVPQDSDQVVTVRALSTGPPLPGVWYHLTGVFDASTKDLFLYVNGTLQGTARMTTSWSAGGALQIGRDYYSRKYREWWPGQIDDVRVWDRRLADTEIQALANTPAVEQAFYPLDEGVGTRAGDVSGNYRYATVSGGATWRPGPVGAHALEFDGSNDVVTASQQAVRTDASFTVSARARLDPDGTNAYQTVVSQDGPNSSGFVLERLADGKWAFVVSPADAANPAWKVVESAGPAVAGRWVNLTGVYDAAIGEIRLYVDGVEHKAAARVTTHAPGNVVIGRAKQAGTGTAFFDGRIDDVHAYTGVLTKDQIVDGNTNPVVSRPNVYDGQLSRFVNHDGRHFVSNGPVPPGTIFERGLGLLAPADAPDTRMLYSCLYNGGWFTSTAANCESSTHTLLGEIGRIYRNPPADRPSYALYRCVVPQTGDHYNAIGGGCENDAHVNEGLQGYVLAYRKLIRYSSDVPPNDHLTTIGLGLVPAGYRPEGPQGMLAITGETGTTAIYSCVDGSDQFMSTDSACDGKTVLRREGWVWKDPPTFAAESAPLFACTMASGERFTSFDDFCEGQKATGRRLGYVLTRIF